MMNFTEWLIFLLGWVVSMLWLVQSLRLIRFVKYNKLSVLVDQFHSEPFENWPKVSIIIPARDEVGKIKDCLISIMQSDYPDLEIICVNDRSQDETGQIMDELAKLDNRIKVVHVQSLPDGWLGKTHAMVSGAQMARGSYLLFTDADVIYDNKVISYTIRYALSKGVDHLCLFPRFISEQFWKRALTTFMGYAFLQVIRADSISDSASSAYAGVGSFNLVKKNIYDAIGGFEPIRLEILDDMALGQLVKKSGCHSKLLLAHDQLGFEGQSDLGGVIRGIIGKNIYAGMSFSFLRAFLATVMVCMMLFMMYGIPFLFDGICISGFVFTLLVAHFSYGYFAVKIGGGWGVAWVFPIVVLLNLYALWRSVIITHYQGGIRWKESFYSLKTLKEYTSLNK